MNKKFSLKPSIVAFALLVPLAGALLPAHAQAARTAAAPRIVSMAVQADEALMPGSVLRFTVQGTPNARRATLSLANGVAIPLRQVSTGNYRGSYTVKRSDRLDPRGVVVVRMTHGSRDSERTFSYPASFQAMMMGAGPAPRPEIDRFVMRHEGVFEPGREMHFRVRGAPGADVAVDIPGLASGVALEEIRPGVYEGSYTLRRRDDPDALFGAVATMRSGERRVTAQLDGDRVRPEQRSEYRER